MAYITLYFVASSINEWVYCCSSLPFPISHAHNWLTSINTAPIISHTHNCHYFCYSFNCYFLKDFLLFLITMNVILVGASMFSFVPIIFLKCEFINKRPRSRRPTKEVCNYDNKGSSIPFSIRETVPIAETCLYQFAHGGQVVKRIKPPSKNMTVVYLNKQI